MSKRISIPEKRYRQLLRSEHRLLELKKRWKEFRKAFSQHQKLLSSILLRTHYNQRSDNEN